MAETNNDVSISVWSEFLSPAELADKKAQRLLADYKVMLGVAFPPHAMNDEYEKLLKECGRNGIEVAIWPLLTEEDGYWPNENNVAKYSDQVKRICEWSEKKKAPFSWVAVDIELPHHQAVGLKGPGMTRIAGTFIEMLRRNRDRSRFNAAAEIFAELANDLKKNRIKTAAAAMDFVGFDIMTGRTGLQDLMETPVSGVEWDLISFMIYTSTIVELTKGILSTRDARWHLYSFMKVMKDRLGDRAGVSVGVTAKGKISSKPYEAPEQLAPDVSAAKAAGIKHIGVYNLEGIVGSVHPEKWFEMIYSAEPEIPEETKKAALYHWAMRTASGIL